MKLEFLLSDHLGSTSITTDPTGVKTSEIKYKPWGEVRYAWVKSDATPGPAYRLNDYTFTGQYSYMDDPTTDNVSEGFGLMFYNARWYDPALGRFAQADTIIPEQSQGTQAWDRYAYVNNNPVKYDDASGHDVGCGGRNASECVSQNIIFFGGSDTTSIYKPGPNPVDQSPMWLTDSDGDPVNVVAYPGVQPYVGISGKLQQAINAQGLSPDVSVSLIAYSAGTESALMYAQWRLDNNQPVDSVVLLGPTFETLAMDFDNPDGGWSAVMDDLIEQGVNIFVLDDNNLTPYDRNSAFGYSAPTGSAYGVCHYREESWDHYSQYPRAPFGTGWLQGTNNKPSLKKDIYSWLASPK